MKPIYDFSGKMAFVTSASQLGERRVRPYPRVLKRADKSTEVPRYMNVRVIHNAP